jgi:parvulin-like peptidyl-prolyl isomerase
VADISAVSDPVRLDDGWHVVKVIDAKASYTRTLSEVRDQLVLQIRGKRATALRRAYFAELLCRRQSQRSYRYVECVYEAGRFIG